MPLAGDDFLTPPVTQSTEAVWIDAPASAIWPSLLQMSRGRGPHGVPIFGNLLDVAEIVDGESIVLRTRDIDVWDGVWSFHVIPHWDDRCRVLIRTRTRLAHPGQLLLTELAAPLVAFVTRGMLRGLRRSVGQRPAGLAIR
jgi:hypothetical protein